jgi:FkbH-like protein
MNLRLCETADRADNTFVLNARQWIESAGRDAFSAKWQFMAQVPFDKEVFRLCIQDVKAAWRGFRGQARKLVLLDLDDTLWGGVVGDTGWENITLGGHDPIGEAFRAFQEALKTLTRRGVLLGIVSKNSEAAAMEAITRNPEMVLSRDDFAGWRINWTDKAANVAELVAELNLGLQSAVFLDDNPAERDRVRQALPDVLVPELPSNPLHYPEFLHRLNVFDTATLSAEDRGRTASYAAERERRELRKGIPSLTDWLASLDLRVRVEPLDPTNLKRAAQLLNKTNQMNLRTRRLTEADFLRWSREPGHAVLALRVTDKFGDSGLTGLLGLAVEDNVTRIVDFVLSCRVMGRGIESCMQSLAVRHARAAGSREVRADYEPTPRNQPCLAFWTDSPFERREPNAFVRDPKRPIPWPAHIQLTEAECSRTDNA